MALLYDQKQQEYEKSRNAPTTLTGQKSGAGLPLASPNNKKTGVGPAPKKKGNNPGPWMQRADLYKKKDPELASAWDKIQQDTTSLHQKVKQGRIPLSIANKRVQDMMTGMVSASNQRRVSKGLEPVDIDPTGGFDIDAQMKKDGLFSQEGVDGALTTFTPRKKTEPGTRNVPANPGDLPPDSAGQGEQWPRKTNNLGKDVTGTKDTSANRWGDIINPPTSLKEAGDRVSAPYKEAGNLVSGAFDKVSAAIPERKGITGNSFLGDVAGTAAALLLPDGSEEAPEATKAPVAKPKAKGVLATDDKYNTNEDMEGVGPYNAAELGDDNFMAYYEMSKHNMSPEVYKGVAYEASGGNQEQADKAAAEYQEFYDNKDRPEIENRVNHMMSKDYKPPSQVDMENAYGDEIKSRKIDLPSGIPNIVINKYDEQKKKRDPNDFSQEPEQMAEGLTAEEAPRGALSQGPAWTGYEKGVAPVAPNKVPAPGQVSPEDKRAREVLQHVNAIEEATSGDTDSTFLQSGYQFLKSLLTYGNIGYAMQQAEDYDDNQQAMKERYTLLPELEQLYGKPAAMKYIRSGDESIIEDAEKVLKLQAETRKLDAGTVKEGELTKKAIADTASSWNQSAKYGEEANKLNYENKVLMKLPAEERSRLQELDKSIERNNKSSMIRDRNSQMATREARLSLDKKKQAMDFIKSMREGSKGGSSREAVWRGQQAKAAIVGASLIKDWARFNLNQMKDSDGKLDSSKYSLAGFGGDMYMTTSDASYSRVLADSLISNWTKSFGDNTGKTEGDLLSSVDAELANIPDSELSQAGKQSFRSNFSRQVAITQAITTKTLDQNGLVREMNMRFPGTGESHERLVEQTMFIMKEAINADLAAGKQSNLLQASKELGGVYGELMAAASSDTKDIRWNEKVAEIQFVPGNGIKSIFEKAGIPLEDEWTDYGDLANRLFAKRYPPDENQALYDQMDKDMTTQALADLGYAK